DEVVVGDVEGLQQREPRLGDELVDPLLRRDAVGRGGTEHLLAVLIGAGEHPGVVTGLPVPAREGVDRDGRVPVADVGHIGGVVDRGRDVEGTAGAHPSILGWSVSGPGAYDGYRPRSGS